MVQDPCWMWCVVQGSMAVMWEIWSFVKPEETLSSRASNSWYELPISLSFVEEVRSIELSVGWLVLKDNWKLLEVAGKLNKLFENCWSIIVLMRSKRSKVRLRLAKTPWSGSIFTDEGVKNLPSWKWARNEGKLDTIYKTMMSHKQGGCRTMYNNICYCNSKFETSLLNLKRHF